MVAEYKNRKAYPLGDFIDFVVEKVEVCVEVKLPECAFADEPVGQFAFQIHYQLEHLVVGLAREHDAAGIELIDGDGGRPQIYAMIVAHPNY